ncbi:hypothetical protein JOC36_000457 [Weissella uvarum]|uniref:5' nucleotidase, NT5C type n=1 Tax=Weissella uvarum TaxID=1479233 RepID=UPI001961E3BC|nr:hypothetical protein [Weissella uvarum]MBM7616924.1 hypothetical protein [Weissella uvarum]MCM0594625.1 hypothetical protein [Weissella uvarum]
MAKPKLFLDMDNTIVDTLPVLNAQDMSKQSVAKPDQIPGIFRDLKPIAGALEAIRVLAEDFDLYILSTAPWNNPSAWQDKIYWLKAYFGEDASNPFYKRVVMAHDKGLVHQGGGILLDDRPYHGASAWDDEQADSYWLQYGMDPKLVWTEDLVPFLQTVAKYYREQPELRAAIAKANADQTYQLHGDKASFEKAHWE